MILNKEGNRIRIFLLIIIITLQSAMMGGCSSSKTTAEEMVTSSETPSAEVTETETPMPSYSPDPQLNPSDTLVGMIIGNEEGILSQMAVHGFLRTAENLGYPAKLYDSADSKTAAALVDKAIEDDCKGLLIWADSPDMNAAVEKAKAAGIEVVVPYHKDQAGVADANLTPDVSDYVPEAARILCAQLADKKVTSGAIVICGADEEPEIAQAFEKKIADDYPNYTVVRFEQELTDENISNFVRKHSELAAVLSLDDKSGKLWNNACKNVQSELRAAVKAKEAESSSESAETDQSYRRSAVILVLDYTEAHLAWVRDGLVFGVIARPYYDSTAKSMAVLDRLLRGLPTQTQVRLDAPVIRKNGVDKYVYIALEVKEWFSK